MERRATCPIYTPARASIKLALLGLCMAALTAAAEPPDLRVETKEINESGNTPHNFEIKVEYPEFTPSTSGPQAQQAGSLTDELNKQIQAVIKPELEDFRAQVDETGMLSKEMKDFGSSFYGQFEVKRSVPNLVGILFSFERYTAGAAHPTHWTKTLNIADDPARTLSLGDLFPGSPDYLQRISQYCVRELTKTLEEEAGSEPSAQIAEGAAATAENYKNFLVTPDSLKIVFDEYQVAPYAAGPQKVAIPWEHLRPSITTESPLWPLLTASSKPR